MKFLYHSNSSVPYAIEGKPAPISYVDEYIQERWCVATVKQGKHKGKLVCLIATFKDKSIVELGDGGSGDEGLDIIPNNYLDFDLEAHLETNETIKEFKEKIQQALTKLTEEDKEVLGLK